MDYEKLYNEALERAKQFHKKELFAECNGRLVEYIFPELKESEDERIRQELVAFLEELSKLGKDTNFDRWKTSDCVNWIAWLEKQCEQKPFDYENANIPQRDFAPKVEPKFKVKDFIKHNKANIICKVISVNSNSYYVENIETNGRIELFNAEQNFHLWTIQDAKDGDVLYSPAHNILWIYKGKERYHAAINLNYAIFVSFNADIVIIPSDVQPATKEQSARLFQKIKEAGYVWDAEKKELKHYGSERL